VPPPVPYRVGGFGGIAGLRDFLAAGRIDAVVDATHPFAAQMARHAAVACRDLGVPRAVLTRPPWRAGDGDRWTAVRDVAAAAGALGAEPRTVFLTVGSLHLAAFAATPRHRYVVRTIDPPGSLAALPSHRLVLARGPFRVADEIALMRQEQVDALVTKNSGGTATEAKLVAAAALGIEVIMIERPAPEAGPSFESIDAVLAWIEAHRAAP
jgi:precorrin-6A/cobalt-precorrin-6A reductase